MKQIKKALKKLAKSMQPKTRSSAAKPAKKKASSATVKSATKSAAKKTPKKPAASLKSSKKTPLKSAAKGTEKKADKKAAAKKSAPVSAKKPEKAVEKLIGKTSDKKASIPQALKKSELKKAQGSTQGPTQGQAKVPDKTPAKATGDIAAPEAKKTKEKKAPVQDEVMEVQPDEGDEEIVLTDADGRRYCRVKDCDQSSAVDGYCRYHYLLLWKKIQVRKKILTEGKLEKYIEDLTARYPDKYLEMLRKDLRNEKDFLGAIHELELDDNSGENEFEDEAQNYIEEVRGMSGDTPARDDDDF